MRISPRATWPCSGDIDKVVIPQVLLQMVRPAGCPKAQDCNIKDPPPFYDLTQRHILMWQRLGRMALLH